MPEKKRDKAQIRDDIFNKKLRRISGKKLPVKTIPILLNLHYAMATIYMS